MKKIITILLLVFTTSSYALNQPPVESDAYDTGLEMVIRPFGLLTTIAGAGLYIGLNPLTALATIPAPHNAFQKLADGMICKPFKWTFTRPLGDYDYNEGC